MRFLSLIAIAASVAHAGKIGPNLPILQSEHRACTAGTYMCWNSGSYVLVCNSLDEWVLGADCGAVGCCTETEDGDAAYCTC